MIYLLHVPKTAGQTLSARIAGAFPPDRTKIHLPLVATAEEVAGLAASHDFIGAHTAFEALVNPPPGLDLMVCVRDPIEQVVSHVRHIRRDPLNPLNAASAALPLTAFLERFADYLLNFQARALVRPLVRAVAADLAGGEDLWLLRQLPDVIPRVRWLVPTESVDAFAVLWSLETGRRLASTATSLNEAPPDDVASATIRAWLLDRLGRFALDSLLWTAARRHHAAWRHGLATHAEDPRTIAPALRAHADGDAGIWLVRDWHPPEIQPDGSAIWWAGPGQASRIRVRRGPHRLLRFEGIVFSGVAWNAITVLRERAMTPLRTRRTPDPDTHVVLFETDVSGLDPDETLILFTEEDVARIPAVPLSLATPRRTFATRRWTLA